jgi:succinate dehydrogenase assembly factor 2
MTSLLRLQRVANLTGVLRVSIGLTSAKYSSKTVDDSRDPVPDSNVFNENEKIYYEAIKTDYLSAKDKRSTESVEQKRSRLLYQSRKRGISENCILLTTFSNRHLSKMNEKELDEYDKIVNSLYNEWELYYWMTQAKPEPEELQKNSIMQRLKEFCINKERESRLGIV